MNDQSAGVPAGGDRGCRYASAAGHPQLMGSSRSRVLDAAESPDKPRDGRAVLLYGVGARESTMGLPWAPSVVVAFGLSLGTCLYWPGREAATDLPRSRGERPLGTPLVPHRPGIVVQPPG